MNDLPSNSDELKKIIKALQEEILLLRQQIPSPNAISPEEQICIQQLRILEDKSYQGELDFEDAKKFEIYHKNLRMARGQVVEVKDKKTPKLSAAKLMEIACE